MTATQTATTLLDRLHDDHDFAVEVERHADDATALMAYLRAEGFDVTDDEVREAFLERYGAELSSEQLDAVAAGVTDEEAEIIGLAVGGVVVVGVAAAMI